MSEGLLKSSKTKQKLFNKKLKNPTELNKQKFCNYNKLFNKIRRVAKKNFYRDKFSEHSKNIKKTWEVIREVIGKKKNRENLPDFFRNNGEILTEIADIAEGFNCFYSNIGPDLASKIPPNNKHFKDYLGPTVEESFIFGMITSKMVAETIGKLKPKTSAGPDGISSKLLKIMLPIILEPITHLFNLSLKTGYIPIELKTAKLIPIYKCEERDLFTNYRPISLLPSLSKILEKIVAKQMIGFLYKKQILYEHQYGFRRSFNTTHPILQFLNKIYQDSNNAANPFTLGVFLDLKKAFDTVNFSILLKKLEHYGFRGDSNIWFQNYLTNREQYVEINGTKSTKRTILCGVPQGSVLGPLLFLIYINDLPSATDLFTILFADDTTFQLSGNNPVDLFLKANIELQRAADWFSTNKLTLNVKKTKFILFRPKNKKVDFSTLNLKIGNEKIERIGNGCKETCFKFVGIRLDEFLTWDNQISHVSAKLSSANYTIARTKNVLPINIRKNLYNSLFRSHMEYGILSWGNALPGKLKKIKNIQKKCIRNVAGCDFRSHTDPLFSKFNVLKFDDLLDYNKKIFMHKLINEKQPESFSNFLQKPPNYNSDNNRRAFCFCVDILKNKHVGRLPTAVLPRAWNPVDQDLKLIDSHTTFKKSIYCQLIDKYPISVNCRDHSCTQCFP